MQQKIDHGLNKFLNKAIKNNEFIKYQHIKIYLSGSSAAGKTNLRYSLLGQKFVEKYESTELQETKHAYMVSNTSILQSKEGCKIWNELDLEEQFNQLKTLWEERFNQTSKNNSKHDVSYIPDDDSEDEGSSEVRARIIESEGLSNEIIFQEPIKMISMIDTGGQPGYIHMLPAIIHMLPDSKNCPTVNLIVIDMTKSLEDNVLVRYRKKGQKEETKSYHLHYTNEKLIELLLSVTTDSFNIHSPNTSRPNVHVGFVGTHKDILEKEKDTKKIHMLDNQVKKLVSQQKCERITINPRSDCDCLYPVSNKIPNDEVILNLREKIEELLDGEESKCLPIRWMILELAIKLHCSTKGEKGFYIKVPYITFQTFLDIAKNKASIEQEEAKEALEYFHSHGILLHFPEMVDYVIVNHQWLYEQLSKLVTESPEYLSYSNHFAHGILLKNKLPKIEMEENTEMERPIKMGDLISLLNSKKILASYTLNNEERYYLPFILPYCKQYADKFKFLVLEPLLIRFSSGFLPRGFFCSLVVHFLQKMPDGWISSLDMHTNRHFRNVMTFLLPNNLCLRLQDNVKYLEIQVRHDQHSKGECILKELKILCKYLCEVCETLKFDCNNLEFSFLCQPVKWDEEDHMPAVLLKPSSGNLKCKKCQNQTVVLPFMDDPSPCNLVYCEKCDNQIICKDCQKITYMGDLHKLWFKEAKVSNV